MTDVTTAKRLSRYSMIGGLAAGVVLALAGMPWIACGWLFIACAMFHLANVVLLSRGIYIRYLTGYSAAGQALQSEGALAMGILIVAGDRIPTALGWIVVAIGVVAFVLGLRLDKKARQSLATADYG